MKRDWDIMRSVLLEVEALNVKQTDEFVFSSHTAAKTRKRIALAMR